MTTDQMIEPPKTTADKLNELIEALTTSDPEEMPDEVRQFVTGLQIAQGMGFDLLAVLRPDDPAACDLMVDKAIGLLLQIRGDDLPPFSPTLYSELTA